MCTKGEWAFSDKSRRLAEMIQPGDHGIIYLTVDGKSEPSALGGSVDFLGMPFRAAGDSIFDRLYPVRLPMRVNHALRVPVPFRPLVGSINFIEKKNNWGRYLQGHAAIELRETDFAVLLKAVNEEAQKDG